MASQYQPLPDATELKSLRDKLVEYLSLGHIEVCESILVQYKEEGVDAKALRNDLSPQTETTTTPCLDFTDKYLELEQNDNGLKDAISELEELLT